MHTPAAFSVLITTLLAFLLSAPLEPEAAEDVPTVSGLQYGVHEDRVRLRLNVAPTPAFALFTLSGPDRLVLDFPALDWAVPDQDQIR